ncbi:ABC transporter permease [Tomitella biformata]|uniref:ABC transporter permease n=1 Tax=Tomitella biformata TaxID=630403 RepID=UPI0004635E30|nr:ABC transporter permease [Tomitella biformata]
MSLAYAASDAGVMIGRSLRHSTRNIETMLTAIMLPVVLMLMFVYVFGGVMQTGTDYVDYVVPGIVLLCAGFGAGSTAIAVANDMENGIVDRFRSMPIGSSAVLTGHVTASVARNLVATAIVIGVGFAVGWRPTATPLEWLAAAGMITLFITAISWLAAAAGLVAKSAEAANAFTFVLMFIPYVSSAFVPTDSLPTVLRGFAQHQPVTPVIETIRGLWMGTEIGGQAWWALGWCAGIGLVSYLVAAWLFRRRTTG